MIVPTVLPLVVWRIKIDDIMFAILDKEPDILVGHDMLMIVEIVGCRLEVERFLSRLFE
jgi:hypothetical protein